MAKILTLTMNPALDLTLQLGQLELGQVNRSNAMLTHAAGKGLNVAQVLADLGHELTVAGFLGIDNQQAFEALFERRHFVDEFVRVPGETRSNIKMAESSGRITDLNGLGRRSAKRRNKRCSPVWNRLRQVLMWWWWRAACRAVSRPSGCKSCC